MTAGIPTIGFRYPLALFLAELIPLALLLWVWWGPKQRVFLPFDQVFAGQERQQRSQRRRSLLLTAIINLARSLPVLLLGIVIAILCGPTRFGAPHSKRKLTNIEFCVDISGSMTAEFGDGSRYDASMKAINSFLDFREGDAFGLTFFGNEVMHWTPLTSDASAIRLAPPYMRPENAPPGFGGTEIGKALLACQRRLVERTNGDRMILLISDGSSSDLDGGNDMQIAKQLRANNIVVYGVHIAEGDVPAEIVNVTHYTGGEVFNPGDEEGLAAVFRRIDEMQQAELEKSIADVNDDYVRYCVAGLAVLGASLLSLFGLRVTPW